MSLILQPDKPESHRRRLDFYTRLARVKRVCVNSTRDLGLPPWALNLCLPYPVLTRQIFTLGQMASWRMHERLLMANRFRWEIATVLTSICPRLKGARHLFWVPMFS
jgi:hypothetical protein